MTSGGDPIIPYFPNVALAQRLAAGPNFVPPVLHDQLLRWVERGQRPGAFLSNVLANDLLRAVYSANEIEESRLPRIVRFIQMELPSQAYGSRQALVAWPEYLRAKARQMENTR